MSSTLQRVQTKMKDIMTESACQQLMEVTYSPDILASEKLVLSSSIKVCLRETQNLVANTKFVRTTQIKGFKVWSCDTKFGCTTQNSCFV
jgi:hypothetical protein